MRPGRPRSGGAGAAEEHPLHSFSSSGRRVAPPPPTSSASEPDSDSDVDVGPRPHPSSRHSSLPRPSSPDIEEGGSNRQRAALRRPWYKTGWAILGFIWGGVILAALIIWVIIKQATGSW
ncbi:hypothetical protein JCM6882_002283 [Rhodosporidiobolus microsporus]